MLVRRHKFYLFHSGKLKFQPESRNFEEKEEDSVNQDDGMCQASQIIQTANKSNVAYKITANFNFFFQIV